MRTLSQECHLLFNENGGKWKEKNEVVTEVEAKWWRDVFKVEENRTDLQGRRKVIV